MKSNQVTHEKETRSPGNNRTSNQHFDVTRRRFVAMSAAGVAGLGALGSMDSAAADTGEHTLVIEGFDSQTSYSFTVGDNLEKSTADGATIDDNDEVIDQSAHGQVWEGKDAYTFDGPLYSFDFDRSGEVNVTLDGEPAHVGQRPDHTLVVEGFEDIVGYSFSTTGKASQSDAYGATIDDESITDYGVRGAVHGGKDAFTYDGRLLSFDFDDGDEIRVTIDGKAAHVGRRADKTVTIVATGDYSEYEIQASGPIREVLDTESGQDIVGENSVIGAVSGRGYDKFTCDGHLSTIDYSNREIPPKIYVNSHA